MLLLLLHPPLSFSDNLDDRIHGVIESKCSRQIMRVINVQVKRRKVQSQNIMISYDNCINIEFFEMFCETAANLI